MADNPANVLNFPAPKQLGAVSLPLTSGVSGASVKELQQRLLLAGADPQGADGTFGPNTEQAVKNFQAAYVLPITGEVDTDTWVKLVEVTADRYNASSNSPGLVQRFFDMPLWQQALIAAGGLGLLAFAFNYVGGLLGGRLGEPPIRDLNDAPRKCKLLPSNSTLEDADVIEVTE